jgi:hypothetical protein
MTNQIQSNPAVVNAIQDLSSSLKLIQPSDNQDVRLITYALVGTAVVGLLVYHYIKNQEEN